MRITGIKIHFLEFDRIPHHWAEDLPVFSTKATSPFLRILTDVGLEGHCFDGMDVWHAGVEFAQKLLIGEDPLNRERVWQRFWKAARWPVYQGMLGSVDVALWDLAGKATGYPVFKLLGGYRDQIPAYASTQRLESVEAYAALAQECVGRGYQAIKLHVWGRPEKDLEACRAVRRAVGDDIALMLDASSMYTLEEAEWVGHALEDLNYYWFEEPIDNFNLIGMADLKRKLRIPLCVAEATVGSVYDAATHIKLVAGDIIHVDPLSKGGLTGLTKIAHLWEAFGLRCAVHGSHIDSLHGACAFASCRFFESMVPEGWQQTPGIRTAGTEVDRNGKVRPWDKPGLGIEVDWDWIDAHTTHVLE